MLLLIYGLLLLSYDVFSLVPYKKAYKEIDCNVIYLSTNENIAISKPITDFVKDSFKAYFSELAYPKTSKIKVISAAPYRLKGEVKAVLGIRAKFRWAIKAIRKGRENDFVYIKPLNNMYLPPWTKSIDLWVWGWGSKSTFDIVLRDNNNSIYTLHFPSLNFYGWKRVSQNLYITHNSLFPKIGIRYFLLDRIVFHCKFKDKTRRFLTYLSLLTANAFYKDDSNINNYYVYREIKGAFDKGRGIRIVNIESNYINIRHDKSFSIHTKRVINFPSRIYIDIGYKLMATEFILLDISANYSMASIDIAIRSRVDDSRYLLKGIRANFSGTRRCILQVPSIIRQRHNRYPYNYGIVVDGIRINMPPKGVKRKLAMSIYRLGVFESRELYSPFKELVLGWKANW